jgi:hypothetical protein
MLDCDLKLDTAVNIPGHSKMGSQRHRLGFHWGDTGNYAASREVSNPIFRTDCGLLTHQNNEAYSDH